MRVTRESTRVTGEDDTYRGEVFTSLALRVLEVGAGHSDLGRQRLRAGATRRRHVT